MWFKNLIIYRVHDANELGAGGMAVALAGNAARPIGRQEARRVGWTFPADRDWHGTQLHHDLQGHRLLTMLRQERILPPAVVREELDERAAEIEQRECRKLRRQERQELKEQVYEELLPKSHIKRQRIDVWWDTTRSLIAVNTGSRKRAEEALDLLRETLGSLKVTPLATQTLPMRAMTQWLTDDASRPSGLLLGDKVELKAKGDDGVVRGRQVDLDSDDMQQLLATGRQASQLGIHLVDCSVSFVLHDDLSLHSLRWGSTLLDEADETEDDGDAIVRLETDFLLMTRALGASIDSLISWMGGEANLEAPTPPPANPLHGGDPRPFGGADDPLYQEAVSFVTKERKPLISALQRRLKIGYNRAAYMIEAMEAGGVVSVPDSQGRRKVLSTPAAS